LEKGTKKKLGSIKIPKYFLPPERNGAEQKNCIKPF
jgi:hypothetical protein